MKKACLVQFFSSKKAVFGTKHSALENIVKG
jgi:hypothetical protein